jgi:hypothetical protein
MQHSESFLTSRGRRWELLHSLWIGWTFTLGFFSWLAFVYIGLRARHPRWILWAVLYATPLTLFAIFGVSLPQSQVNAALDITIVLGVVSVVHAFLIRKEYLLRLNLIQRETSRVSLTSMGSRWELLHSLWMAWTFTFGLLSWVAFLYIGFRTRQIRWLLWGLVYFAAFAVYMSTQAGSETQLVLTGLMVVIGIVSVVHAFAIRGDYLVRLENRMHETSEAEATARRRLEEEYETKTQSSPSVGSPERSLSGRSSDTNVAYKEPDTVHDEAVVPPAKKPRRKLDEVSALSGSSSSSSPEPISIADTYPLPIAYSWSLFEGLWDPRDRYREQLRHAENILAFLGSTSLAILDPQDYERAQIDLRVPWQGGISFGAWKLIVQRSAKVFRSYENHPLATAIRNLDVGSETSEFGADIAALISARNNFHHGRGPTIEEDFIDASNEAQERLQRCMEALSFFTHYPIRLVQDFDVDRRSGQFVLKCLRWRETVRGSRRRR